MSAAKSASAAGDDFRVVMFPIEKLQSDPDNARIHDDRNIEVVRASLERFGWMQPIVARIGDKMILAGHGRVEAAKRLGMTKVPVFFVKLNKKDGHAYAVVDNRAAELAQWDSLKLAALLAEMDADLQAAVGFSAAEISAVLDDINGTNADVPVPPTPPKYATSRTADLWILGENRLLCGDSTKPDDVKRLMGGIKAKLLATDPPFGVDLDQGAGWGGRAGNSDYREVAPADLPQLVENVFRCALPFLEDQHALYCWMSDKHIGSVATAWEALGILFHQCVVWAKPRVVPTRQTWLSQFEIALHGWVRGAQGEHHGTSDSALWAVDYDGKNANTGAEHPAQKPLELFARPMRKHTDRGDVCLEPFSGSGSQLLAGEEHGRRVFAMEISPRFVDVAILRWQTLTNREAVLDGDGRTFAEVAKARSSKGGKASKKSKRAG